MSNMNHNRGKQRSYNNSGQRQNSSNRNDNNNTQRHPQHGDKPFYGGKPQNYRNHHNDRPLNDETRPNARRNEYSDVQAYNVESHPGASLDNHKNETHNTFESYTSNIPVPIDSSVITEVPREPSVETVIPTVEVGNLRVKVTGANEKFDEILKRIIDTHPDKNKFLSELENCSNVVIETFETQVPVTSALSATAPEFRLRTDQCYSSDAVNNTTEVQQPFISNAVTKQSSDIDTKNDEVLPQETVSSEPVQNSVKSDEEEEEGAVGGTSDQNKDWSQEVDAWDKTEGKDWAEEEKENLSYNKQYKDRKSKYDNQKQNNRRDQGKQHKKVKEVSGDLFTAAEDSSLAHCVGSDMRMGSGIAVTFKRDFKNQGDLLDQKKGVGEVAILEDKNRFIYYLVTKKYSTGKPRYEDLEKSLKEMRDHCIQNGVKKLAMPRIGCGLDRLEWSEVKPKIEEIFSDVDISITVYNLNADKEEKNPQLSRTRFVFPPIPLIDIESETGLVFFGTEDGNMDECGKMLDKKFNFALDFRKEQKQVGAVLKFEKKKEFIYGIIVKKKESDPLLYVNLEKCLIELRKKTRKDKTYFIGFQAFYDEKDDLATEKFITLARNVFFLSENEIHVCYPQSLEHLRQGDKEHSSENNKNSEDAAGKRGREKGGERKSNWNPGSERKKEIGGNWRN